MMRRYCMVPSNTLSASSASRFALRIIERPIFDDYLSETLGLPRMAIPQVQSDQDWWDVDVRSYARVLSRRHRRVRFETVLKDNPKRPDISTFEAPIVLRFAFGDITKTPPIAWPKKGPTRSEIYEVKPRNSRGRDDARAKLDAVEASFVRFGITNIYRRGLTYPFATTKYIPLEAQFVEVWRYLFELRYAPQVRIQAVDIEVCREFAGGLLYRICPMLDHPDWLQRDDCWRIANFAVRLLFLTNVVGHPEATQAALTIAETLEPADPAVPPKLSPIVAGRDLSKVPYLNLIADTIADEIKGRLGAIRDAMYSRLIGKPGEQYFLCCDEAYYQNAVVGPLRAKVDAQIAMLRFGTSRNLAASPMFGLLPSIVMTAQSLLKRVAEGALVVADSVIKWATAHPMETVIIVTVAFAVTAALIVAVLPSAAGAGGAVALAGTATTAEVAAGAIGATEGAVVGMPSTILAQTPAVANLAAAAVPDAVLVSGSTSGTALTSASAWAQAVLAAPPTAAELAEVAAQQAIDKLLLEIIADSAVKSTIPKAMAAVAGAAIVGLSSSPAYAAGAPRSAAVGGESAAPGGLIGTQMGRLFVIKVPRLMPYPSPNPPALHTIFDAERYIDKAARLSAPVPAIGRVRMLGILRVV
jgi:hypothetical protein